MSDRGARAYDPVAALYDQAFADIRVRRVEWRWLNAKLSSARAPRVLDLGCGTGALLHALAPRLASGVGVDVSRGMLTCAQRRLAAHPRLSFLQADPRALPFFDASFDVVISFLSFRYLDWPSAFAEIRRVLAPDGRFLMIDLVSAPLRAADALRLGRSTARRVLTPLRAPIFSARLRALVSHPAWGQMLRRHPMRPLDAYREFFRSELPGVELVPLDVARGRRIVALDSGAIAR
jgi:ubiquinone/menaquinone biosynthesis C-methylase UbiE